MKSDVPIKFLPQPQPQPFFPISRMPLNPKSAFRNPKSAFLLSHHLLVFFSSMIIVIFVRLRIFREIYPESGLKRGTL